MYVQEKETITASSKLKCEKSLYLHMACITVADVAKRCESKAVLRKGSKRRGTTREKERERGRKTKNKTRSSSREIQELREIIKDCARADVYI